MRIWTGTTTTSKPAIRIIDTAEAPGTSGRSHMIQTMEAATMLPLVISVSGAVKSRALCAATQSQPFSNCGRTSGNTAATCHQ